MTDSDSSAKANSNKRKRSTGEQGTPRPWDRTAPATFIAFSSPPAVNAPPAHDTHGFGVLGDPGYPEMQRHHGRIASHLRQRPVSSPIPAGAGRAVLEELLPRSSTTPAYLNGPPANNGEQILQTIAGLRAERQRQQDNQDMEHGFSAHLPTLSSTTGSQGLAAQDSAHSPPAIAESGTPDVAPVVSTPLPILHPQPQPALSRLNPARSLLSGPRPRSSSVHRAIQEARIPSASARLTYQQSPAPQQAAATAAPLHQRVPQEPLNNPNGLPQPPPTVRQNAPELVGQAFLQQLRPYACDADLRPNTAPQPDGGLSPSSHPFSNASDATQDGVGLQLQKYSEIDRNNAGDAVPVDQRTRDPQPAQVTPDEDWDLLYGDILSFKNCSPPEPDDRPPLQLPQIQSPAFRDYESFKNQVLHFQERPPIHPQVAKYLPYTQIYNPDFDDEARPLESQGRRMSRTAWLREHTHLTHPRRLDKERWRQYLQRKQADLHARAARPQIVVHNPEGQVVGQNSGSAVGASGAGPSDEGREILTRVFKARMLTRGVKKPSKGEWERFIEGIRRRYGSLEGFLRTEAPHLNGADMSDCEVVRPGEYDKEVNQILYESSKGPQRKDMRTHYT